MEDQGIRRYLPFAVVGLIVIVVLAAVFVIIQQPDEATEEAAAEEVAEPVALTGDVGAIAQARELTPADVSAALKTYVPTGRYDDYFMFSSGGHAGQVFVIGMPS
ncbi:MAG: hypothetical protein R3300_05385, partial [Candidatus Promineifilaceae bacterium]|nr:hypothetical protein [Candidatus Promineifilaceae bacterium]